MGLLANAVKRLGNRQWFANTLEQVAPRIDRLAHRLSGGRFVFSIYERQRRSFENTAEDYDRYRPTYPDALFDDVRSYADLAPDDPILEVGAGTGRATVKLAAWGNPIVAHEPAPHMAELARRHVDSFDNVQILTSRLEDAKFEPNSFGLVVTAQAWHWLDHGTRMRRFADALYSHGVAAIIENVQVVPPDDLAFWERAQDIYRKYAPGMEPTFGPFISPDDLPAHPLAASDLFEAPEQVRHPWHWTLNTTDYLRLCATHSNKAALDADIRERLLEGIGELIDAEFGGHVTEYYVAVAGLARKR